MSVFWNIMQINHLITYYLKDVSELLTPRPITSIWQFWGVLQKELLPYIYMKHV